MPHGRKDKKTKQGAKKRSKKPKKPRKRHRPARTIDAGFGRDFRRPRRFAMTPRRGPARVLHKHSAAFMLGALAQDLLTPLRPAPNWLTQRAPPFVPYDPWQEHRRHTRIADARQRAEIRREIEAERAGGAVARAAGAGPAYAPWGDIRRAAAQYDITGERYQ